MYVEVCIDISAACEAQQLALAGQSVEVFAGFILGTGSL